MQQMTTEETVAFLSEGTRTGKLAWVAKDGSPHVAPIWFVVEEADPSAGANTSPAAPFLIAFNTDANAGKALAMRREGRASMVVDDQAPPYSFVKIDATVTFADEPADLRAVATKIGGRYMGLERAEEFGARNGSAGELVVRLTPTRITAAANISG